MSRFSRFGLVVATSIVALIGFVPTSPSAGHPDTTSIQVAQQAATPLSKGGDWCC